MPMIRDGAADEIVRKDRKLQDHIHARTVILWLPAMSAGVAVQISLMIAGIGIALSLLFFWPLVAEHFKYYVGGIAIASIPMAVLSNLLVRGTSSARINMFRLSVAYACLSALETLGFLLSGKDVSAKIAVVGLVASLTAVRLVSGPSYALLAAIYRAQRTRLGALKHGSEQNAGR